MTIFLEQFGSELSLIRSGSMLCSWNRGLHFCRMEYSDSQTDYVPSPQDNLLHDLLLKGLQRGVRPFPSYYTEETIISLYGWPFGIEHLSHELGSITYSYDSSLVTAYEDFNDIIEPWRGDSGDIDFDPEHPENERKLFDRLIDRFGDRLGNCIETQVDIPSIIDAKKSDDFLAQRADLLLSFPNHKGLLLEPGDHEDNQLNHDNKRDRAFRGIGIETLRPRNSEINEEQLYKKIEEHISLLDANRYLDAPVDRSEKALAANYLFLLPSLIARVERLLLHFFLHQGLMHKEELRIGIIERDLECAEISIIGFLEKLKRLIALYGLSYQIPSVRLHVQRNPAYRFGKIENLEITAVQHDDFLDVRLDLVLDVGIKCNSLTKVDSQLTAHHGSVRQCFPHNRTIRFAYRSQAVPISVTDATNKLLSTFVQDYFRKHSLRSGQGPVIRNVLSQKPTIGLLPTSAGKSMCYQLASLLTPGTTIIVDPLVALMRDQVQSLKEQYGIDRVIAWHASAGLHTKDVPAILSENSMIFISPERLQRNSFRSAMNTLGASDIFINYVVIDEAHCVSMWGHDFRPSYLTLKRNFQEFCTFQGREPVLVALTGTASQLVLIDLKRELDIQNFESIIRPDTFDRPELNFNIVKCPESEKAQTLEQVTVSIAGRLNVQRLDIDAHGIIFTYTPNEVWKLFGQQVGNAEGLIRTVLSDDDTNLRYGIYTGSSPKQNTVPLFYRDKWEKYKEKTLLAFKRGQIQMLFGNTAVSVGIDNERLNYVINYRMPQSMESYYQQCGRAGRSRQHAECFLIFSDDEPNTTQRWLDREIMEMPQRFDDLGTISYFHQNSFPGQVIDSKGTESIFRYLFSEPNGQYMIEIPMIEGYRTERYISHCLILGFIVDYEVSGTGMNTTYQVRRHPSVDDFMVNRNKSVIESSIIDNLHSYLSRYRPISRSDVKQRLNEREEKNLSVRGIGLLVSFIYEQIEYQRRESIRTMVSFCNEADTSPELLRTRIRGYFDTSDKFSALLLDMSERLPDFNIVAELLDLVDGFDDVEHLYWETRRLLDERFRPDWASISLYAVAYREKAVVSNTFMRLFGDMIKGLRDELIPNESGKLFLGRFLGYLTKFDDVFNAELSCEVLARAFIYLYRNFGLEYLDIINDLDVSTDMKEYIHAYVAVEQLGRITNAGYAQITG